jgi:hypothetical protein
MAEEELETIRIVHNEGEEKPWEIKFENISVLKQARATLNYPVRHFDTEAKAMEVADMLRDIIQAEDIDSDGTLEDLDGTNKPEFFQKID